MPPDVPTRPPSTSARSDGGHQAHAEARRAHWDAVARRLDSWRGLGSYYHRRLAHVYRALVSPGVRVLEVGCGQGDLLAALEPGLGVGVDISPRMLERARRQYPAVTFVEADANDLSSVEGPFDVIVLSDLVNDLWDVQRVFDEIGRLSTPNTRVILNFYSRLWEPCLRVAQALGLAKPAMEQNWLTVHDVAGLAALSDFEMIRHWPEVIWPFDTPVLAGLCNHVLTRISPFAHLSLTNFVVLRRTARRSEIDDPLVSVIVPARNEAGNIRAVLERTPEMGRGTEIIFVEGHSRDDTYATIEREIAAHPARRALLFEQTGTGKGDAVRLGFARASGDVLMILDADLTVPPEDLPRFYDVLRSGKGDVANGVRLVYPMEDQAMRFVNFIGNKAFGITFSWLIGQPIRDTLCGTKAMTRASYETIAADRAYFGDFDPFGDFDLLLGAARKNLKIVEVPIRYRQRTYGTTNIHRWTHGWLLARMVAFAARRLKFV